MPVLCASFSGMVRAFTLPEVNCRLELTPQYTLPDPAHIGGFILMIRRYAVEGWVEVVLLRCLCLDNAVMST